MGDLEESNRNWNKQAALEEIESLKAARSTAWDEHTHSFRWLMASLLAVNGGACLSVFDKLEVFQMNRLIACASFVTGIVAALLVAVFGQRSVQNSFAPLNGLIGYWMTVAHDGVRDEEIEVSLANDLQKSAKIGFASRISGWVSALAFVFGVLAVGLGINMADARPETEVEASAETVEMPADGLTALPKGAAAPPAVEPAFKDAE